ncbi:MAG: cupin domain-containing protein [Elusimicrobia bacterium]|nr:cupin domain-containing protein [Candidatus Liberimonas magnetica]
MDNAKTGKGELIGKAIKLNKLISYQAGSIVSRVILKKETGNITLFAFDKGQALSEHKAPFDAYIYILEGGARIMISGKKHDIKAGEMIILPANEPHALEATNQFKMVLTMIRSNEASPAET